MVPLCALSAEQRTAQRISPVRSTWCRIIKGAGSQLVVSVCQHTLASSFSKAVYRVAVELCEAAQLCVYLTLYLYLGVLLKVCWYAGYVLITGVSDRENMSLMLKTHQANFWVPI